MNAGAARTADLERLRANSEERVADLTAKVEQLTDELEKLRAARTPAVNLCAVCENHLRVGPICVNGVWLCLRHGKAAAMKELKLTEADLQVKS